MHLASVTQGEKEEVEVDRGTTRALAFPKVLSFTLALLTYGDPEGNVYDEEQGRVGVNIDDAGMFMFKMLTLHDADG